MNTPEVFELPVHVIVVPSRPLAPAPPPQARMLWKKCADAPVGMDGAQAVVIGEKVYMGGGVTEEIEDSYHVFQYNTSLNEWSRLPKHPAHRFAMAQFMGSLITVGGEGAVGGVDIHW